jgi:hypothetical protein
MVADRHRTKGHVIARLLVASLTFAMTASTFVMTTAPASAAPRALGPNVTRIDGGTLTTFVNGAPTGSFGMSEFRIRGNSSATWPKKPYGVVFGSAAQPFNLPAGKRFRLLANYHDRSLLRNKVAFDLAAQMSGLRWTPRSVFTELFVNGKYRGSYQLIEEITAGRLGLTGGSALVAEFAAGPGRHDSDGMHSTPHDPENGALMAAMIANHVDPFLASLRNGGGDWRNRIDTDSFVDHYLVREFTKDNDADFWASNFYYTADVNDPAAKMFMGPVWDFDRSAGNEKSIMATTVAKPSGWWVRYHNRTAVDRRTHMPYAQLNWYNRLVDKPEFAAALCARWRLHDNAFRNVGFGSAIPSAMAALGGARVAKNDRKVWGRTPVSVVRPASRGSWKREVRTLQRWYQKRYVWMNANIC